MNYEIDEITGLPRLPEGQYWRIEKNHIRIMGEPQWTDWTTTAGAYRYSLEVEERLRPRDKSKWWEQRMSLKSPKKLTEYRYLLDTELTGQKFGEWDCEWSYGSMLIKPDPVTRENVVERCQALLEREAAEELKKAQDEAFYGDYPPKKLEDE